MKKPYEEPEIVVERFPEEDVISCSITTDPEDPGDDPEPGIVFRTGANDA